MASNMTKAFQNKSRRALGCRPGYEGGGTTDIFQTGSNSFGDRGAQLMSPGVGGAGVVGASAPLPTVAPSARSAPIYGAGPKQTGFVWEDGTPRVDTQPQAQAQLPQDPFAPAGVGRAPLATRAEMLRGASAQDIAPAGVGRAPIRTLAEQQMAAGHDPNGRYRFDRRSGRQEFYADGGVVKEDPVEALMRRMKQSYGAPTSAPAPQPTPPPAPQPAPQPDPRRAPVDTIRGRNEELRRISNYADGGAVVKEDPVEALLRRTSRNYGVPTSAPAPAPTPTPQPTPQPDPRRSPLDTIRGRNEELKRISNYADGGAVRQVEFHGQGGPRDDKIPVRFAGADIRVSDGERGVILPAKTAANPYAVDAIEDIIQGSNDGRAPRRALGDGGRYADSNRIIPYQPTQLPQVEASTFDLVPRDAIPYTPETVKPAHVQAPDFRLQTPRDLTLNRMRAGQSHIMQSMGDAARLNGSQQSAEFAKPQVPQGLAEARKAENAAKYAIPVQRLPDAPDGPIPASAEEAFAREKARIVSRRAIGQPTPEPIPQNIAPEIQIPPEPAAAPTAEPAPKKGLVSRKLGEGVDKLKSMFHRTPVTDTVAQTSAKTPSAAEAAAEARRAATTYKLENPVPEPKPTFRAKLNGASSTSLEDVGRAAYRGAKKALPSPAGAITGTAIGAGLEGAVRGLNTDTSEYAQRVGIDEPTSVLGATALRTAGVLSDVGASVINTGALPYNLIKHGIDTKAAGEAWDKAQNRYGYEKPLAALGGATKDWWDYRNNYDDVRAAHAGAGSVAPSQNATERAQALGKIQQADYSNEGRYSNAERFTPADIQRQRELAQHTGNAGTVGVEPGGNRIRWQASKGYNPTAQVFEPGTGAATVTGEAANGGRMMPGVKRNALGASIAIGPGDYLAKDGSRTANWYKTRDYEDAIRRNTQMQVALSQIQNERAGRDPMASRALGQTMLPPGATAATGAQGSDELLQQALQNLASPDPGTRALGQHQLAAQNQMITQQMARARTGVEMRSKQAEMANADKASSRSDMERFDKELETAFRTKGGKDGNEDVPDHKTIAEFKEMAAHTAKANLDEAKSPEQRAKWTSAITNKAREAAELDAADRAAMLQQFKVFKRHQQVAGHWLGDSDLGESKRLDYWTPHITKDGEEVYFPKMLKDGKPLRGKTKQYAYTKPIGALDLQRLATPTDDILANAIRDQ